MAQSERHDPHADNPKMNRTAPAHRTRSRTDDWVTGGEPMTGAQASYLKTLSEQAHKTDAFDPNLARPMPPSASMS
jgi:hypothetical protein